MLTMPTFVLAKKCQNVFLRMYDREYMHEK